MRSDVGQLQPSSDWLTTLVTRPSAIRLTSRQLRVPLSSLFCRTRESPGQGMRAAPFCSGRRGRVGCYRYKSLVYSSLKKNEQITGAEPRTLRETHCRRAGKPLVQRSCWPSGRVHWCGAATRARYAQQERSRETGEVWNTESVRHGNLHGTSDGAHRARRSDAGRNETTAPPYRSRRARSLPNGAPRKPRRDDSTTSRELQKV